MDGGLVNGRSFVGSSGCLMVALGREFCRGVIAGREGVFISLRIDVG